MASISRKGTGVGMEDGDKASILRAAAPGVHPEADLFREAKLACMY